MPVPARLMTETEARQCAKLIRHHIESARKLVLDLYEREGWRAMGYASWRACVLAEFSQSQSHLYRHLDAARIEREVSPIGETGTIPEAHLRPLAAVAPGRRKAVWDEVVATVPAESRTARRVSEVAARVAPTPAQEEAACMAAALDAGIIPAEPADIAAQRAAGIIPEGVEVEVYDPFAFDPDAAGADEDGPDMLGEQTEAEFLATCPAREHLAGNCLADFDRDALLYRQLAPAREKFANVARRALAANRRKGRTGNFHSFVSWFLKGNHPRHWLMCAQCKGTGRHTLLGECTACHAMGYITR